MGLIARNRTNQECVFTCLLCLVVGGMGRRERADRYPRSPGTHPVTTWSGVEFTFNDPWFAGLPGDRTRDRQERTPGLSWSVVIIYVQRLVLC